MVGLELLLNALAFGLNILNIQFSIVSVHLPWPVFIRAADRNAVYLVHHRAPLSANGVATAATPKAKQRMMNESFIRRL